MSRSQVSTQQPEWPSSRYLYIELCHFPFYKVPVMLDLSWSPVWILPSAFMTSLLPPSLDSPLTLCLTYSALPHWSSCLQTRQIHSHIRALCVCVWFPLPATLSLTTFQWFTLSPSVHSLAQILPLQRSISDYPKVTPSFIVPIPFFGF